MIILNENNFLNNENKEKWMKDLNLDEIEEERLYNWVNIDGKYYYVKSNFGKYHELVGEEIAKSLNLKTAHYEICKKGDYFYYISPNFKDKNKAYKHAYELYDGKDKLKEINDLELIKEILKMYALDIFMMQVDRTAFNFLFEVGDKISLAPLYDYSCSYFANADSYKNYNNALSNLNFNNKELSKFKDNYPEIEDYLDIIYNTDYLELLKENLKNNDIKLDKTNEKFYNEKFKEGRKLINKIYRA